MLFVTILHRCYIMLLDKVLEKFKEDIIDTYQIHYESY